MLVPVAGVRRMAMTVVHVVSVVAVADGLVAATFAVLVLVIIVLEMGVWRALVPVTLVLAVGVPVVEEVGVVAVRYSDVAAAVVMAVGMVGMGLVGGGHYSCSSMVGSDRVRL